jgi:PAS domain S-box-containing protein
VVLSKQSVIINNPEQFADHIGKPTGSLSTPFLGVPLIDRGNVIGLIALGDNKSGYTAEHREELEALSISFVEVNRRKQAEEDMRTSEDKYRSIFENAVEGIFQATSEGRLIKVNPAMARINGFASPEEMTAAVTDIVNQLFVDPEDGKRLQMLLETRGAVENYEARIRTKDGACIWTSVNVRAVKDHARKTLYYEGTAEDISDRKLRESEREEALREISDMQAQLIQTAKMAALGQLASGIAHEIKNPLAVILGGIEYLDAFLSPDPSLKEVGEMMKSEALRADKIIKDLLSFSRKTQSVFEETDIVYVIEESLSLVEHQMGLRNIRVVREFYSSGAKVLIDPNQMKQVFINLIMNAVDAMTPGGGTLTSKVTVTKDRLVITLSDTGCGIPPDHLTKIFGPFFTTKEKGKNTGLGLSITRQIIEAHGGTISVESELGQGTTFTIELIVANHRQPLMAFTSKKGAGK